MCTQWAYRYILWDTDLLLGKYNVHNLCHQARILKLSSSQAENRLIATVNAQICLNAALVCSAKHLHKALMVSIWMIQG